MPDVAWGRARIAGREATMLLWLRGHSGNPEEMERVSGSKVNGVEDALAKAGVEVYRTADGEVQIAERVRFHLMDSGVRVRAADPLEVVFTVRCQRSDFPHSLDVDLFDKVRGAIEAAAGDRGYREIGAAPVEVTDPMDESKVLDVWFEVTYRKTTEDMASTIDEVRWALGIEKYVTT